jgi:hypothetical protein
MKTITKTSIAILLFVVTFSLNGTVQAQNQTPEWLTNLPVKKGFI